MRAQVNDAGAFAALVRPPGAAGFAGEIIVFDSKASQIDGQAVPTGTPLGVRQQMVEMQLARIKNQWQIHAGVVTVQRYLAAALIAGDAAGQTGNARDRAMGHQAKAIYLRIQLPTKQFAGSFVGLLAPVELQIGNFSLR